MNDICLHPLGQSPKAVADVIFVHGLGGNSRGTWTSPSDPDSYWPRWIFDDFQQSSTPCSVWMLDYPAEATNWTGRGNYMALPDRARNAMEYLANVGIGKKPVVFVAHSLGGLLTKYILRNGSESSESTHRELAQRACAVVFMATPHRGSDLASILKGLSIAVQHLLLRISAHTVRTSMKSTHGIATMWKSFVFARTHFVRIRR